MAKLDLTVNVLTKGAEKLDGLSGKLGGIGKNLTLGVTTPLLAAAGGFVALAAEAEKSEAKLKSVFDSTEASAWTSVEALDAHAQALADATTFDDDAIKDAQAALLAFGTITGDEFTKATDAAADLAAFMDTDIPTAAGQLGKALSDPEAGLGRLQKIIGPLTDAQQAAIDKMIETGDVAGAQQLILDAVSDKIGQTAEDLAATGGGQMTQAMNELSEAGESLGVFLLPAISAVAGFVKDLATGFQELDPQIQQFILIAGGIAAVLGPVLLIFSAMLPAIGAIGVALGLLLSPIGIIVVAVAAFAVFVATHWDRIVEQTGMLVDAVKGFLKAIGDAFGALGKWIGEVWDTIVGVFEGAVEAIGDVGKKLWTPIEEGFDAAIKGVKGIWNAFVRFWNSIEITVPSVDIPIVGRVGGFTIGLPDLPRLAEGGIVTQPTLALIGERGPEAVVPLNQMTSAGQELHIHLENHGPPIEEDDDIIETLQAIAPLLDGRLAYGNG